MGLLLIVIKFLTLLSVAYCFSCPKGVHNFFHVDVSSGCRVYHQCLSSELLTLTCPFGQAFDDQSIKCVDASLVDCIKKPFSRHRRSAYSLKDRLILPIISEMMNDGSTKHHLGTIFRIAKSSYNGVQEEMKSNYGQPASRSTLMSAKYQFFSQTIGTMGMLVDKHLAQILKKMSENVSLIYSNMGVINNNAGNHGGSLTDKILQFVKKHPSLLYSSNFVNSNNIHQIRKDFAPIKSVLFQIFEDYLMNSSVSWTSLLYRRDSFFS